jgi:glycosyltransferase 2 family protein
MKIKLFLKLLVSATSLSIAYTLVDFSKLGETMSRVSIWYLLALCIGYLFGQLLSSYKWWLIVNASGINVPYTAAIKSYFTGMFLNIVGIGTVGGDVARGILVTLHSRSNDAVISDTSLRSNTTSSYLKGIATVVTDRLHGLTVLAIIGIASQLLFGSLNAYTGSYSFILNTLIICFVGAVILVWLSAGFFENLIATKCSFLNDKLRHKILEVLAVFPKKRSTILLITILSAIFHFTQIYLHILMGSALGLSISLQTVLISVPFINILSTLPISWQGLGVRENCYRFFLVPYILSNEQAVMFGALWIFALTLNSIIGGVIALFSGSLVYLKNK